MVKKRLLSGFLILLLLSTLVFAFSGCTSETTDKKIISITDKEDVYIYDTDNCIDDEVEQKLNHMLIDLENKTEAEFAVISIPSLNNMTIEEYSSNLFNNLGIGKEGKDNGVLLLFSKSDNKVRLEIGRGFEGFLNDAKCGRILDNYFVPYREENKYTEATENTVNAVLSAISEEYDVQIQDVQSVTIPDDSEEGLPTWVYIVILIILVILKIYFGGSSSGGYYGGSSGGFSSGGGFGRGRTGGGGASR